ncbi:MAG TPA: hypothetical protein VFM88_04565 [Vicinamibacteria bacterium]|nr:hypothetical protein [Vicinamibacteria bacterium]
MFTPTAAEFTGGFTLAVPPEKAFELFSPLGEKQWVPEWNPELLHPPGANWERGLVFRTHEDRGEAVWIVTALDRAGHQVEYHRVESGRYLARVSVRCRGVDSRTEVRVLYAFVGLSDTGNREIAAMSAQAYEEKMRRWKGWIDRHLSASRA